MPQENANPAAILEAIRKIEIVSELLDEKNKNNLKMIAEGKVAGGKQIGPYARLLTYSPGEVIMNQGDWGGNAFYFSVDGELPVFVADESGEKKKVGAVQPGACFGEMSIQTMTAFLTQPSCAAIRTATIFAAGSPPFQRSSFIN